MGASTVAYRGSKARPGYLIQGILLVSLLFHRLLLLVGSAEQLRLRPIDDGQSTNVCHVPIEAAHGGVRAV